MNKAKTVFWVIIVGFILLVFFQNQAFFLARQSLRINLLFYQYQSPEVPGVVFFLAFFLVGLLIAYFFGLAERFQLKKTIKSLSAKIDPQPSKTIPAETAVELQSQGRTEEKQNPAESAP